MATSMLSDSQACPSGNEAAACDFNTVIKRGADCILVRLTDNPLESGVKRGWVINLKGLLASHAGNAQFEPRRFKLQFANLLHCRL